MILVVGATGLVGSGICRLLGSAGKRVRGLVRASSDAAKVAQLQGHGADLVTGDLKDPASLARACAGVDTVISTASCTLSRQNGDSIETVDRNGQLELVDAAVAAGAKRFVFISFPEVPVAFPLQDAKRAVEQRLRTSGLTYTILQPTFFAEIWLSPALGFDVAQGKARIYGTGTPRISWISSADVAKFAVAALDSATARNAVIELGGSEALSPLECVRMCEKVTGRRFKVEHVPEVELRASLAAATDPLERSFAGLMLYYALGDEIAPTAYSGIAIRPGSVRDLLKAAAER